MRATLRWPPSYCDSDGNSIFAYEYFLMFGPGAEPEADLSPLPLPTFQLGKNELEGDPEFFLKTISLQQLQNLNADFYEKARRFYQHLPCESYRQAEQIKRKIDILNFVQADTERWHSEFLDDI